MNVAQRIFVVGMLALSSTLVPLAMASAHTAGAASHASLQHGRYRIARREQ